MKAKDKAEELIEKFASSTDIFKVNKRSIQCALICVDEILTAVTTIADRKYDFYQQVKQEIINCQ